jgi:hypothetical protein
LAVFELSGTEESGIKKKRGHIASPDDHMAGLFKPIYSISAEKDTAEWNHQV